MLIKLEHNITNLQRSSLKWFSVKEKTLKSYWHFHPEIEIVYVVSGTGIRFIGDNMSSFVTGELILIGENTPHNYISRKNVCNHEIETICIQFSKDIFNSIPECKHFLTLFAQAKMGISVYPVYQQVVSSIQSLVQSKGVKSFILLVDLIEQIYQLDNKKIIMLDPSPTMSIGMDNSKRLNTVLDFINSHYNRAISLQEIASVSYYTPTSFTRWFKKNMGVTFVTYLNKVRLTYACQLLLLKELPVSQIAIECGFENISTFNRLFKKQMKKSPSKYKTVQ